MAFKNSTQSQIHSFLNDMNTMPSNSHETALYEDSNEREKNLLEKVKQYKKENQQLIMLLKESEATV